MSWTNEKRKEETPLLRKEGLVPITLLQIKENLRTHMVVHLGALVPLHSEVLSSPVRLPITGIIPGMIDLILDDLLVEGDVEGAIFQAETRMNE